MFKTIDHETLGLGDGVAIAGGTSFELDAVEAADVPLAAPLARPQPIVQSSGVRGAGKLKSA